MNWNKLKLMAGVHTGTLLRPQKNGVALIEDTCEYFPFFNCYMLHTVLAQMLTVLSKGYTPYVSFKGVKPDETNWDTFFRQPFDCQLTGSEMGGVKVFRYSDYSYPYGIWFNTPYFKYHYYTWCKIYNALVRLNQPTADYIEEEYQHLFCPEERVLGVLCRGTDYATAKDHPIQPRVEQVISDARRWMQKYNYTKIYLATECQTVADLFQSTFPGKIITNQRTYYDGAMQEQNCRLITQVHFNRENDNYLKGLQYLSSMVLLSRCNALLAGNCGGSLFALHYNNRKYEHFCLYNLGRTPK